MYELARLLASAGRVVSLVCYEAESFPVSSADYCGVPVLAAAKGWDPTKLGPLDVAIYSESVADNPLQARRVVRYLMNLPGILTNRTVQLGDFDFVVAYSRFVDPQLFQLFLLKEEWIPAVAPPKRNQVAVHFGKVNRRKLMAHYGAVRDTIRSFSSRKIITRSFPARRRTLVRWLASSRVLVSFDPLSNIHYEATLLGTPVIAVDRSIYGDLKGFNLPLHGFASGVSIEENFDHEQVLRIYRSQLASGNQQNVANFVQACLDHFQSVESSALRLEENRRRNQDLMREWQSGTRPGSLQLLDNVDSPLQIPQAIAKDLSRTQYYWFRVLELWNRVRRRFPLTTGGLLRFCTCVRVRLVNPVLGRRERR